MKRVLTSSRTLWIATLAFFALTTARCRPQPAEDLGAGVVARVDNETISARDLLDVYRASSSEDRARIAQPGGRHRLLDLAIADVLLEREARARGLAPSYSAVHAFHESLLRRFLAAELDPTIRAEDVPEAVVRAEYDRLAPGLAQHHRRHLRVLAHDAHESAEAMISEIASVVEREGIAGVEEGIRAGTLRTRYGQDDVFSLESARAALGAEVADAGFALAPEAVVVAQPIPYRGRWGVVIVRQDLPGRPAPSFEEVADQVRARLHQETRDRALDALVASFRNNHLVEVHDENLALVPWLGPATAQGATGGEAGSPSSPR